MVKQNNFKTQEIKDSYVYFLTDSMGNFCFCCSSMDSAEQSVWKKHISIMKYMCLLTLQVLPILTIAQELVS